MTVVFIGHNTCRIDGSWQHAGGFNGISWPYQGFCAITNFSSDKSERKTILHEIGHWFHVEDHYGGEGSSTIEMGEGYSEYCIYGEKREDPGVLDNMTICDGCQSYIKQNASNYNH